MLPNTCLKAVESQFSTSFLTGFTSNAKVRRNATLRHCSDGLVLERQIQDHPARRHEKRPRVVTWRNCLVVMFFLDVVQPFFFFSNSGTFFWCLFWGEMVGRACAFMPTSWASMGPWCLPKRTHPSASPRMRLWMGRTIMATEPERTSVGLRDTTLCPGRSSANRHGIKWESTALQNGASSDHDLGLFRI